MSKIKAKRKKTDNGLAEGAGLIGILLIIFAFFWGNPDKKSQVLSPKLKSLLSDDENAKALLDAIEKEKSGADKTPVFQMNGKKYKLERAGKHDYQEA